MSEDKDSGYIWPLSKEAKKAADQAAALLGLSDSGQALATGLGIVLAHARAHARGTTEIVFCTPKVKALIDNNPKFIEALCEEGVVECLTPLVLTKSKQGGIAQSTTDHQPTMKRLLAFLFANRWRGAAVKAERPLSKEEERLRKIDLTTSQLQSTLLQLQQTESKMQEVLLRMKQSDNIARMQRARSILRSTEFRAMQAQEVQEEIDAHRKEKQATTPEPNDFQGHFGIPHGYDLGEDATD